MSSVQTTGRPTTIADAGAAAAVPGLTGGEQRVFAACKALSAAADAVERHSGRRAGEAYDQKMQAWRDAYAEWRRAMRAYAKSTVGKAA